eukprot:1114532-Alexandrium_andersonii.AAC.1
MRDLLTSILAHTWYLIDGCSEPTLFTRGTKQGDPLGDILFGIVAARIAHTIQQRLQGEGLIPYVSFEGSCSHLFSATPRVPAECANNTQYADDYTYFVLAQSPSELVDKTSDVMSVIHS